MDREVTMAHTYGNCRLADTKDTRDRRVQILCEHGIVIDTMTRVYYAGSNAQAEIGQYRHEQAKQFAKGG